MKEEITKRYGILLTFILGISLLFQTITLYQPSAQESGKGTPPPVYNPYPPGLLPPDLVREINRVNAEIDAILQATV